MDYSSKESLASSIQRRQNFAQKWSLDLDLNEDSTNNTPDSTNKEASHTLLWEPCTYQDINMSLPIELLALNPEDICSTIFSMDVWDSLSKSEQDHLKNYLPKISKPESALIHLFSGENIKFGNPMKKFVDDLQKGHFNAEVQKYKRQIAALESQRTALSMKVYHNQMIRSALEYKKRHGMKVDDDVLDYFRTQPESEQDALERRYLERAENSMKKRLQKHELSKKALSAISSSIVQASKLDRQLGYLECGEASSSSSLVPNGLSSSSIPDLKGLYSRALADIGINLPKELQVGLEFADGDVWLSAEEEDDWSSDTASAISDNEIESAMSINPDDQLAAGSDGLGEAGKRKKRKRNEMEALSAKDSTSNPNDTTIQSSSMDVESVGPSSEKKPKLKKRVLPPPPLDEPLFVWIKNIMNNPNEFDTSITTLSNSNAQESSDTKNSTSAPSTFTISHITKAMLEKSKLSNQIPSGYTSESFIQTIVTFLSNPPKSLAATLLKLPSEATIPFIIAQESSTSPSSNTSNSPRYSWNAEIPPAHLTILPNAELLFLYYLSRNKISAESYSPTMAFGGIKNVDTIEGLYNNAAIQEFHSQELERYLDPEKIFKFTSKNSPKGCYSTCIVPPTKATAAGGRPSTALKLENRPPAVTMAALLRDAIARLPGGVGTKMDVARLVSQSQFILKELDLNAVSSAIAGTIERASSEWDPFIRYDADLKLCINLHRQRSESDWVKMKELELQVKTGDSDALWAMSYEAPEQVVSTSSMLTSFIER